MVYVTLKKITDPEAIGELSRAFKSVLGFAFFTLPHFLFSSSSSSDLFRSFY